MIINHDFGASGRLSRRLAQVGFGEFRAENAADTLMVGFDGPTSLVGFRNEPDHAIYLSAARFLALTGPGFLGLDAQVVLTPLVSNGHDVLDFAAVLDRFGFRGRYRAVIRHLPDRDLVTREVRVAFPNLDFAVVEIGDGDVGPVARNAPSGG